MAPRFQSAKANGNNLCITVTDNNNPITEAQIDLHQTIGELEDENHRLTQEYNHFKLKHYKLKDANQSGIRRYWEHIKRLKESIELLEDQLRCFIQDSHDDNS
jgi:SMC interacting uncharacterized protein involved in chromosome segregation